MKVFKMFLFVLALVSLVLTPVIASAQNGQATMQSVEGCPSTAQGKGGAGPVSATQENERAGNENGQGVGNREYAGPPPLVLICMNSVGEVYRPQPAADNLVSNGQAEYGACPDVVVVNNGGSEPIPTLYTVYLPLISKSVVEPVVEAATTTMVGTAYSARLVTTRTLITTTVETTMLTRWERVDTIITTYTYYPAATSSADGLFVVWVILACIIALMIGMLAHYSKPRSMRRWVKDVRHALRMAKYRKLHLTLWWLKNAGKRDGELVGWRESVLRQWPSLTNEDITI